MKIQFFSDLETRLIKEFGQNSSLYKKHIKDVFESHTEYQINDINFVDNIIGQDNKTTYMGILFDENNKKIAFVIVIPPNLGTRTGYIAQQVFPGLNDEISRCNRDKNAYLTKLPIYIVDLEESELTSSNALNISIVKKLGIEFFSKVDKPSIKKLNDLGLNGYIYNLYDYNEHINKVATRNGNTFFELDDNNNKIVFKVESLKDGIKITNEPYFYVMKSYLAAMLGFMEGYKLDLSEFNTKIARGNKTLDVFRDYCEKLENLRKIKLDNIVQENFNKDREKGGKNILLYGVPGSGKSHTIKTNYCEDESKIERVVFHPDYMNTDLIGQILPTIKEDGMITYEFTSGPFTKILKKAYENPSNNYYLVIEEINRGNAPAIFGEVFQLLDRDKDGNSTYGITNENISKIVYDNPNQLISIPSNLWILATMNTADQNVFTLDTAFQRRWIMRMIKNDIEASEHANMEILDTGVTWKIFAETINNQIISSNSATMSSEDKRLGAYFITKEILLEDKENMSKENFNCLFAEKVIKYLWDDVFKFGREKLFNPEYKSLERIIEEFSDNNGFNRFDIFETSIKDILKEKAKVHEEQEEIERIEEEELEKLSEE